MGLGTLFTVAATVVGKLINDRGFQSTDVLVIVLSILLLGGTILCAYRAFLIIQKARRQHGAAAIAAEVTRLSQKLRQGLKECGVEVVTPFDQAGGITSFKLPIEPEVKLLRRAQEEQILIAKRGEFIRTSVHAFCGDDEIRRFLEVVRETR